MAIPPRRRCSHWIPWQMPRSLEQATGQGIKPVPLCHQRLTSREAQVWQIRQPRQAQRQRFMVTIEDIGIPSHSQAMSFFESEIVQQESQRLFEDYQQLMRLGSDYGKFDREGKKLFIAQMEALMERYRIFMKRFELSDDFQARMTVEQFRTQLGQLGITPDQMFEQAKRTLEQMRRQTSS